jgi:hypothetical protein
MSNKLNCTYIFTTTTTETETAVEIFYYFFMHLHKTRAREVLFLISEYFQRVLFGLHKKQIFE